MTRKGIWRRILSLAICVALLAAYIPTIGNRTVAAAGEDVVADPGTAYTWQEMMGTEADGNRYAGRVWADKSVYKDGDTAVLNTIDQTGASFQVDLEEDEAFQTVFSVLGSSMTTTTTTSKTSPLDVVIILDNSDSMRTNYVNVGGSRITRMENLINAANTLLESLLSEGNDVRLGITAYALNAATVLPFGTYNSGVELRVNNYTGSGSRNGVITAYNGAGQRINSNYQSRGYETNTNVQAGFDLGLDMLADAAGTANRKPVVILLTDGAANTAVDKSFYDISEGTVRQVYYSNNIDPMIALSTLLSNAYKKAAVEEKYGKDVMIYGVGVDLSDSDGSNAIIDPKNNFNSENKNANIRSAYDYYTNTWLEGRTVNVRSGNYTFTFDHNYPAGSNVGDEEVAENISYVDTYYPVASANLDSVFDQIYQELSSGVFNPISSTTTVEGATGVDNTPLIYVDFIGQYMEVKEIQSVTLFGGSYGVTKGSTVSGTEKDENGADIPVTITSYTVAEATGKNPTTNEDYNTAEDIQIQVIEYADKTQKLEVRINQEILPILLEKVEDRDINGEHTATITEIGQRPLRVYYTVGIDADILLPNGEIDVTKIQGYTYVDGNQVTFYANQFGQENTIASGNGDAHVGFEPAKANRYYYHQTNQDIFTAVSRKDGGNISWDASEYGVRYQEKTFNFTWLTYENYGSLQDDDQVYTYVTYYHPTAAGSTAAEEVTYLVYTKWGYLKESVAFYDHNAETYINYNETNDSFSTGDVGYAIPVDKVAAVIAAYKAANPNADIYGMLGVESLRTSRLHNMTVTKETNATGTAGNRYAPEYTHETAKDHHGNDVVVWLGNNGKLTTTVDTGIALTKWVTETIGSVNDTYALTVTVPTGVTAEPVVKDIHGNAVASTYANNVLTVNVKADETVYISGIPAGTVCNIGEDIPTDKDYYVSDKTAAVTVPTLQEVLNGAKQYAEATVTNSPNKYGDLTIVKDISHNLTVEPEAMKNKEFTFQVQLDPVPTKKTYALDKENASLMTESQITVDDQGKFTVKLKDNESATILGLPAGTGYRVTETDLPQGYTNASGVVSGTIQPDGEHDAHFVNTYGVTPIYPQIDITGTKTVSDPNGTYTDNEKFVFSLSMYNGSVYNELATAGARNGESFNFDLEQLLPAPLGIGEHYFRVTEYAGNTPGMSYDATRGLFKVTVTDNDADGVLEFAVADAGNTTVNGNTVTKNFTNIYNVARTHVDINITKHLENNTGVNLPLNMFHFQQVNTGKPDGDPVIANKTVTTDASGEATIRVSDLGPGEYTFTLTEQNGGMAGMTYDSTVHNITVTVTKDTLGVLQAVTKIDGVETTDVTFNNTYALTPVSHTISGTKTLTGKDIEDDEFQFALYETDSSFELGVNPTAKQTVKNTGNSFSFSEIKYTKVGTYYYSVKEVSGGEAGYTYDTIHYHITVTVSVDGAKLKKEVTVNKIGHNDDSTGSIAFVNTYTAKPTEYAISGTKVMEGRAMAAEEFTFELYEGNAKVGEAKNKADGTFTFDYITYTVPGTYTYTVKEKAGNAPGVTYATNEVEVKVTVTDTNAVLSARADKTADQIRFVNTYEAKAAQVTFNGVKTLAGGTLQDGDFTFFLYETDSTFDVAGKTPKTARNADGKFAFNVTYDKNGTYFYAVMEDTSAPKEGIVYDGAVYHYMVQVTDAGDGQLRAAVTDLHAGETTDPKATAAVKASFTNATFEEVVEKEVFTANSSTNIDGKKVNAGDMLTYHITYTNYNGVPVTVGIMDTVPEHTTYVEGSASHSGTYAGTHILWVLNVAPGESVTVSFDVTVDEEQSIVTNTAVVRDGVNTFETNEVVNHSIDEEVTKDVFSAEDPTVSIAGEEVNAGDTLIYQITYHNTTADVVDVTITDKIPANTTYVEGSADHGGVYANGEITWQLNDIPAWSSVTVTFKVTVNEVDDVTITNKATVTAGANGYTSNAVVNKVPKTSEEAGPAIPEPDNSKTGDEMNLALWFGVMTVSAVAMAALLFTKKKEEF